MRNITLTTLFLFSLFSSCTAQNKASTEWVETIGNIEGVSKNRYIYYEVNNVQYRQRYRDYIGTLYEGEKGWLSYNINNPEDAEILYWKPCFLPNENTVFISGCIKMIQPANFLSRFNTLTFEYSVENYKLQRLQVLPPNYKELYPNLKVGQSYEVECWAEDAQRAIIHLDKPIK